MTKRRVILLIFLIELVGPAKATESAESLSAWSASVGTSVITAPKYPGSKGTRTLPVPSWNISYGRYYSRGPEFLGVHWVEENPWSVTSSLQYVFAGRKENLESRLYGLGDIGSTLRFQSKVGYTLSLFTVALSGSQDIAGRHQGLTSSLDTTLAVPFFRGWFFTGGPGITWSDQTRMQTFFGVSESQSQTSRFRRHEARAGLENYHLNIVGSRTLSPRWSLSLIYGIQWFTQDALKSPIVQTPRQNTVIFSVRYTFKEKPK